MLLLLLGCAPGPLDEDEAALVYEALTSVNGDTYARIVAVSAPEGDTPPDTGDDTEIGESPGGTDTGATAKALKWYEHADGGEFDGTLAGPGSWTGVVRFDGTYRLLYEDGASWSMVWSTDVTYDDVAYAGVHIDGDFRWDILVSSSDASFAEQAALDGELRARGAAVGEGGVHTYTTVAYTGGRYSVSVSGTVGGHDISTSYDATAFGL